MEGLKFFILTSKKVVISLTLILYHIFLTFRLHHLLREELLLYLKKEFYCNNKINRIISLNNTFKIFEIKMGIFLKKCFEL